MVARFGKKRKQVRRDDCVATHDRKAARERPSFGRTRAQRIRSGQGTRGCPIVNAWLIFVRPARTVTAPVSGLEPSAAGTGQRQVNLPCENAATATRPATAQVTVALVGAAPSLQVTRPTTVARVEARLSRKPAIVSAAALARPVASPRAAAASSRP